MCALQQVIGYTILDVNRTLQQNSLPVTEQQQEALNNKFRESGQNVAGKGPDFTTESTTQSASLATLTARAKPWLLIQA